jgi:hypothetical protein
VDKYQCQTCPFKRNGSCWGSRRRALRRRGSFSANSTERAHGKLYVTNSVFSTKDRLKLRIHPVHYYLECCMEVSFPKMKSSGSNTRDRIEKFPASDGQIACHYTHLLEGCDMEKKSKSWIYSVCCHLRCCIEVWKLTVGGRRPRGGYL